MSAPHPSLSGKLVTLFGGGGFLGRHAAQLLMQHGARVRIVQRHPERAFAVRTLGNLGQSQFVAADAADADAVRRALTGSDMAVNLIGILRGNFERAHVTTAQAIARAAAAEGCSAMVQVSAIGADAASASAYGRSKAAAEAAVLAAFPSATILRPSIVFGRQDQFINRFAGMIASLPVVPVMAPRAKFQPIFVGDVAAAIASALATPAEFAGQTFELGGAQILSMIDLQKWIAERIGRHPRFVAVPVGMAGLIARGTGWLPGAPITADQWAMLGSDNVVGANSKGLADLGVTPTPLDAVAHGWLDIYRRHGRFAGKAPA